jgi:hypothetical protein
VLTSIAAAGDRPHRTQRQVVASASSGLRVGAVLDVTAVLTIAVVDHVGQRP